MLNECLILIDINHNKSKYHLSIFQTVLTLQTLNNTLEDLYFKLEIVNEGTASFNLFYPEETDEIIKKSFDTAVTDLENSFLSNGRA